MLYVIVYLLFVCVEKGIEEYRLKRRRRRAQRAGQASHSGSSPVCRPRQCERPSSLQKVVEQPDGAVTVAVPCVPETRTGRPRADGSVAGPAKGVRRVGVVMALERFRELRVSLART